MVLVSGLYRVPFNIIIIVNYMYSVYVTNKCAIFQDDWKLPFTIIFWT